MSTFVGTPIFLNLLWVAMETMHFHIAHNRFIYLGISVSQLMYPNEHFDTHVLVSGFFAY